ncbi:MAG: tetratricopeptide repeat protein [Hahellaceae bacterium]|nr:tetratricopeptide repeat protein [Hahellaceae bacterium]
MFSPSLNDRFLWSFCLAVFLILLVCAGIYAHALNGPFVFDDFENILNNQSLFIQEFNSSSIYDVLYSGKAGPLGRPLSMLSFALNYYVLGPDSWGFKTVNLAIHLINTLLVFGLLLLILRALNLASSRWNLVAALMGASLWSFHPLNLTSVLYVVQRMTSLSALFLLMGVNIYMWQRMSAISATRMSLTWQVWSVVCVILFTGLAALSKESGLLLPVFIILIEWFIFRGNALGRMSKSPILIFMLIILLALLVGVLGMFFDWHKYSFVRLDETYQMRSFSLMERLLTEARVLWFYVYQIGIPNISQMGLHHDDFIISKSLVNPLSTLFSVIGWFLVVIGILIASVMGKVRWLCFVVLWFLVGHLMESTVLPLELVHEHRNYIPMVSFAILGAIIVSRSEYSTNRKAVVALMLVTSLLFSTATFSRASNWRGEGELILSEVARHPHSARAQHEAGRWYAEQLVGAERVPANPNYTAAREHFALAVQADPADLTGILSLFQLDNLVGYSVDPAWANVLANRLANEHLSIESSAHMVDWLECITNGGCRIGGAEFDQIAQAHFSVDAGHSWLRSMISSSLGGYVLKQGNLPRAAAYFRRALDEWPKEPAHWENLLRVLIGARQLESANSLLASYQLEFPDNTKFVDEFQSEIEKMAMPSDQ